MPHSSLRLGSLALAVAIAMGGLAFSAHAQEGEQTARTAAQKFTIPAGPLGETLGRIARESGRNLSVDPALLQGRRAPAIRGQFSPEEAVRQALAGSGLELFVTGSGTLSVQPVNNSGVIDLEAISVAETEPELGNMTEGTGTYTLGSSNTATKMDLSLRHTPQTITVISHDQLDDFKLDTVNDALSAATGVNVQRVETNRTYFTARGFDISNFQIDGLGQPFSTGEQMGDLDTSFYDHIEVLKGANGLTANPGNPAATINFVRKRPTADFHAVTSVGYGSWNNRRTDIDFSGALNSSGTIRGRLVGSAQKGDSYLDRYNQEKYSFYGIAEADLGSNNVVSLGHTEQINRPNNTMWGALPLYYSDGSKIHYSRSDTAAPNWSYWNTTDRRTFLELHSDLGHDWKSELSLNFRDISGRYKQLSVSGVPDKETGLGVTGYASSYRSNERQIHFDFYAKGPFELLGRTHQLMFGASWSRLRDHIDSYDESYADGGGALPSVRRLWATFPEPAFDNGRTGFANFTNHRRTLYAALNLSLTDKLNVIAGINHAQIKSGGVQYAASHDYRYTRNTTYFGATYDLTDNLSAYASYTEIFNPQNEITQDRNLVGAVQGRSTEAGIKGEWFNKRLNASLSIYRTVQNNLAQYAGFDNTSGFSYYEGVNNRARGFEADISGQLMPGWEINAGYSHLFTLEDDEGHRARTFVPKTNLYMATSARMPFLPALKLGANVTWQSNIYRDEGETSTGQDIIIRQGSYAITNLMGRYDITKNLNIAMNVNNLFDKKYLTSLYWNQSYYGAPRNAMVTLEWKN
ncbi:TonB-dependent siderophore receptor [Azomonas macrocytogenes]|uniref:Outer membrane receptor for ferric coprogen and ferric-rhodotorulic acid n=1 Tax=Azomonas macrocytogenes TaxID=69962 RepID=A0A839T0H1_AZOMA|nr:TonB-dependent siderophore receptor [Azomonas macrocytogenes]MBB3103067.1 outer membrane receptor for ferric coprogen and ferric-rhodotorulic acid [Azomonas macrocytogenes]